ncbi:MAG TPA: SAM-dependent methyltransferase [Trebonia sp.]|nr:SAM-dependent methyltransferase [Trebonia sp.]
MSTSADEERTAQALERLDVSVAHIARVYDYWLGGKDNFAADRAAGDATMAVYPGIRLSAQANRAFLARAVRHLAGNEGIRQFLDVGTGLPTANNTHEVAQATTQDSRIVYVDNDPLVLAHARALLTGTKAGTTAYLDADLRDTDKILARAAETLDFSQPVAIMLMAILHYIKDLSQARQIVARLLDAVPSGSFLVLTHAGIDLLPEELGPFEEVLNRHLPGDHHVARTRDAVTGFFDAVRLLEPGVVPVSDWRPDLADGAPTHTTLWGGVGLKP